MCCPNKDLYVCVVTYHINPGGGAVDNTIMRRRRSQRCLYPLQDSAYQHCQQLMVPSSSQNVGPYYQHIRSVSRPSQSVRVTVWTISQVR